MIYFSEHIPVKWCMTVLYPTMKEYTLFSSAHKTFTKTDHILNYKVSLNKFEEI